MAAVEDYRELANFLFDFGYPDEAREVAERAIATWGAQAESVFAALIAEIDRPYSADDQSGFIDISDAMEILPLDHEKVLAAIDAGDLDAADAMGNEMVEILGYEDAIPFHLKAAEGGHLEGQNHLAEDYYKLGNFDKALHWYTVAAEAGHSTAQNNLAMMYLVRSQPHLAYPWLRKSADAGNEAGKNNLAELMANEGDFKGALLEIEELAESGHPLAQNNAGLLHANLGNLEQAKRFWLMAAKSAEKNALFNLGVYFEQGGDDFLSRHWLNLAARRGHEVAKNRLGIIDDDSDQEDSIVEFERSIDFYELSLELEREGKLAESQEAMKKSAELGFSEAQYDMGIRLLEEWSQKEGSDPALRNIAMDWFVKAARQGHEDALYELRTELTPESFKKLFLE